MKKELLLQLFDLYPKYMTKEIQSNFISHNQLLKELESIGKDKVLEVVKAGESLEKKNIYSLKFGHGRTKLLIWSQMHGDEPTATTALLDLFKFLRSEDLFDDLRKLFVEELQIHFIPMLNPDGADRYQRENAINIDLNRDAIRQQSDESALLWHYAEKLEPEFGFNLHNQNSYHTAGKKNKSAAISLLAPPADHNKSISYSREKSMLVILSIYKALSNLIPEHIARYNDDFEPRAFGDNFTKLGISSILIESGYYPGDINKDLVRKLNFISLLEAFESIASRSFEKNFYSDYFQIPENQQLLYDLVLRNLTLNFRGRRFIMDIGINRKKKLNQISGEFYFEGTYSELGDLSTYFGIEEHDLSGHEIFSDTLPAVDKPANFQIIKDGQLEFEVTNGFILKK